MDLGWFKIVCLYPITNDFYEQKEGDDELREIQIKNIDEQKFKEGEAFINLAHDPIKRLDPGYYLSRDGSQKKKYCQICFESGDILAVPYTPEKVYIMLAEYLETFPEKNDPQQTKEGITE